MVVHTVTLVALGAAGNYPSAQPVAIRGSLTLLAPAPRRIVRPPAHHRQPYPPKLLPTRASSLSLPTRTAMPALVLTPPAVSPEPAAASPAPIFAGGALAPPSAVPVPPVPGQTPRALAETGEFVSHLRRIAYAERLQPVRNAGFDASRPPEVLGVPALPAARQKGYKFNDIERNIAVSNQSRGAVLTNEFSSSSAGSQPLAIARTVVESGFGSTAAANPRPAQTTGPPVVPEGIQILEWPRPPYTSEARAHQIEGEVLLETVFTSEGEVRIIRVVRGLGYGLDENAVVAARAIRFAPARRDGRAVDLRGIVRLTFHLAY